jgi:hypothetical protein
MTTDVSTHATDGLYEARGTKWTARLVAILAVVAACSGAIGTSRALAGTWMQVSCASGSTTAAASPGWSTLSSPNPSPHDGASTVCGDGQSMTTWLGTLEPAHAWASETLEYQPPTGSTLAGGSLDMQAIAAGHGPGTYAEAAVYAGKLSGTPAWSCAYDACPQGTRNSYIGQVQIPSNTGGNLFVGVICEGEEKSSCLEGEDTLLWANTVVTEARLLLSNDATPQANGFAGSLLEGQARGTQQLDLTATDTNGPGVYSVAVESEGKTLYSGVPDTNSGACVPTGTTGSGAMMFDSPQPCKQIESVELPVETTGVADGEHSVNVVVTDAAQNTTTTFAGNVTTHNAPLNISPPTIVAANGVGTGAELSSTPGEWSAPPGAGAITDAYQWERCSPTGTQCEPIPGATGVTYTPTAADAGQTVALSVTAVNRDGQTARASSVTGLVAAETGGPTEEVSATQNQAGNSAAVGTNAPPPPGTPNGVNASTIATIESVPARTVSRQFTASSLNIAGRLVSGSGTAITGATIEVLSKVRETRNATAIEHVSTGANGAFQANIPAGPSRTITFAYRAFANESNYAAVAKINESVAAAITLSITPKRVERSGTITITGQVLGFIPPSGVKLALEVFYHGRWVSMPATRTRSDGRFRLRYQFQHATGTFPFRIKVVGGQAGFPYSPGSGSNRVDVQAG